MLVIVRVGSVQIAVNQIEGAAAGMGKLAVGDALSAGINGFAVGRTNAGSKSASATAEEHRVRLHPPRVMRMRLTDSRCVLAQIFRIVG